MQAQLAMRGEMYTARAPVHPPSRLGSYPAPPALFRNAAHRFQGEEMSVVRNKASDNSLDPHSARPTLAELARAAGVNKSTASRALRGDHAIGIETRARIQQLAVELRYEPNASARRLYRAQTDVLAFTSPSLTRGNDGPDPFLVELLSAITDEAANHQQDLLLCNIAPGPQELDAYHRVVGGRHADGIILMDIRPDDPRLRYLCDQSYPHVLFGRPTVDMEEARRYPYPWVDVDNRTGAREGTEHVLKLGHTRIAFLGADKTYICELDRLSGYRDALTTAGIPFDETLCTRGGITQDDGYQLTRQLLEHERPPTAIFAASDVLAVGAMRAATDAGHVVGRNFPVIGFDGLGLATFVSPPLTTLHQPIAYVGRKLVQLLIETLRGASIAEPHLLLQPDLIVRDSTQRA